MTEKPKTGWWNPNPANGRSKWHYIGPDGRSLCGKWLCIMGDKEQGDDDHQDNCPKCRKALEAAK